MGSHVMKVTVGNVGRRRIDDIELDVLKVLSKEFALVKVEDAPKGWFFKVGRRLDEIGRFGLGME